MVPRKAESLLWRSTHGSVVRYAGINVSGYDPLWNYTNAWFPQIPWNDFLYCLLKQSNNICHHYWIKIIY